jgi:chemotaxis protein MotB
VAEKEPIIVIKKITVAKAGHHGGSWKVAFADFMTALMSFFLLMWLLGQSDQVKKNVSDYFSTPSVIEYNFSNYGVELTLEKLFLDLVNEPLKFFQAFMTPADYTPNFMQMGSKNIVLAELADQLGDMASAVMVSSDEMVFEIPEKYLFLPGTGNPGPKFIDVMDKVRAISAGLEDSNVYIDSRVFHHTVKGSDPDLARRVSNQRLDLVVGKVQSSLEHETVDVFGKAEAMRGVRREDGRPEEGSIRFRIKQKDKLSDGSKPRRLGELFGGGDENMDVYNNFVKKLTDDRKPQGEKKKPRRR